MFNIITIIHELSTEPALAREAFQENASIVPESVPERVSNALIQLKATITLQYKVTTF
jgi:hypothetical protein